MNQLRHQLGTNQLDNEIARSYVCWLIQEEYEFDELENFTDEYHMDDDMQGMLHDAFGVSNIDNSKLWK